MGAKILDGTVWTTIETWTRDATAFLIFLILARLLGPSAIGLVALAMSAPLIFSIPVVQGIPDALVQRADVEDIHLDSAFWLLLGLGAALTGLIWACSGLIAAALGEPSLEQLIRWTSLIVVIRAVAAVPTSVLRRQLEFRVFAQRTILAMLIGGLLGIFLAWRGFGVWSLVAMNLVRSGVESLFLFWTCPWRPRVRFSRARCADLFGFGAPVLAQSLVRIVNDELPKIALGIFLSPAAVGVFALARKPIDLLVSVLIGPINRVAMPAVARLQAYPGRIDRLFDIGVRATMIVGFPAFAGFAAIAELVIPPVLGPDWIPAIATTQILMLLGALRSIDGFCGNVVLGLGYARLLLALHIAYTALGAVLFTLAARFSVEAMAWAVVASNYLLLPIFLYQVRMLAGIDIAGTLRRVPRVGLATLGMFVAVVAVREVARVHLAPLEAAAVCVIAGVVVYGVLAALILRDDVVATVRILRTGRLAPSAAEGTGR